MKAYAYDVYSYTDATGWKFHFANLFGSRRNDKEAIKIRDGFCLGIGDDMECRGRFIIYGKWAKDLIKDYPCYSIKTTRYQKGRCSVWSTSTARIPEQIGRIPNIR